MIRNSVCLFFIFHPFNEIVNKDRPSIILVVVFIQIFDMITKLEHHIP